MTVATEYIWAQWNWNCWCAATIEWIGCVDCKLTWYQTKRTGTGRPVRHWHFMTLWQHAITQNVISWSPNYWLAWFSCMRWTWYWNLDLSTVSGFTFHKSFWEYTRLNTMNTTQLYQQRRTTIHSYSLDTIQSEAEYILPEITANFVLKIFTTKFVLNDEACARNGNRANFSENDKIPSFLLF